MNLQLIKTLVEKERYPGGVKGLAEAVGMTEQNLHRCVRENKIQAQDLEKISIELEISISEFFKERDSKMERLNSKIVAEKSKILNANQINELGSHDNINSIGDSVLHERLKSKDKEIENKDRLIAEKDARIEELKDMINELKKR
ncbi:XRE family transcriptional regulator [bacterium]|nr:XRE family transcriptional regulator [bacterium]MBD5401169.1 XRE family transcriptional regulator [bacterium]